MTEARAPRGSEWADVTEVLHGLSTVMTVRSHYVEGHPAIARADATAKAGFERLLDRFPELVIALIDGEFVVSERPLPELRSRLGSLADAMTRHEIECIVFQRGITVAECSLLGRALAMPAAVDSLKHRDETQAGLAHVLLRFAELKSSDQKNRQGGQAEYLVPAVQATLGAVAQTVAREAIVDRAAIRATAQRIVSVCHARAFALEPRAWAAGISDHATHATNVALMTAAMVLDAGYDDATCVDAAAAAMLHDVGQLFLPQRIRGIPSPLLADADKTLFHEHTTLGAIALLGAGAPTLWVDAALEHHRGVDGGGYPQLELRGAPHEIVGMIALASFVDKRRTLIDGKGDEPEEALRRVAALEGRFFARATIQRFLHALGVYPPGTIVELSDRSIARVVSASGADPVRPQVRLLFGENAGKRLELKDLSAVEDRHVTSIVRSIPPPLVLRESIPADGAPTLTIPDPVIVDAPPPTLMTPSVVPEPVPPARVLSAPAPVIPAPAPAAPAVSARPPAAPISAPAAPAASPRPPAAAAVSVPAPASTAAPAPSRRPIPRGEDDALPAPTSERSAPPPRSVQAPVHTARAHSAPPSPSAPQTSTKPAPPPQRARPSRPLPPPDSDQRVPVVKASGAQLMQVGLDHRAAFILTFVDGASTMETILDACGLSRDVALGILEDLVARGVLAFK